jgi:hypothetical protein
MSFKKAGRRGLLLVLLIQVVFCFAVFKSLLAQEELKKAEKLISSMRGSLDHVAVEIRKAIEQSNISLVNCLRQKEQIMKNYTDASTRNQENMRTAYKNKDTKEVGRFYKLIEIAQKNVKDLEARLKECWEGEIQEKATKVMVIKPEGATDQETIEELYPEKGQVQDGDRLPVVPPASPFK